MAVFVNCLQLSLLLFVFVISADALDFFNNQKLNAIDKCWRANPFWAAHREQMTFCSVGFCGKMRKNRAGSVKFYQVTDSSDDSTNPRPGTLRYGATMVNGTVWITFKADMTIKLNAPLLMSNRTTIDGRVANVHIANGAGILLYGVRNVIIHGIHFHNIVPQGSTRAVGPGGKVLPLNGIDGDCIRLVNSYRVWIDHNTFSNSYDGLVDVTHASTRVTISNNRFSNHNKVLLLGHADEFVADVGMRVTIAFNHFGPDCVQRMPRIRHGYAHIVNNVFDGWGEYAVGGGMNPIILSQANHYIAPAVKKAIIWENSGMSWNLKTVDDVFLNGAFFTEEGKSSVIPRYGPWQKFPVADKKDVPLVTKDAGALQCQVGSKCL